MIRIAALCVVACASGAHGSFVGVGIRFDEDASLAARALGGALADAQVYRMFVAFDAPGDVVLNIFNTSVFTDNGATLYQDAFAGDVAPNSNFFGFVPSTRYDSFVTINELSNTGTTSITVDPDFNFSANGFEGGWANTNPPNLQGLTALNPESGLYEAIVGQFTLESVTTSGFWVGDGGITWNTGIGTTTFQLGSWSGLPGQPGLVSPIVPYPIPAPGALAAFTLGAGLAIRRRR